MSVETRLTNLEKKHPPGQNFSIVAIHDTMEVAIKKYEEEHGVKVDMNDETNQFLDVVFI